MRSIWILLAGLLLAVAACTDDDQTGSVETTSTTPQTTAVDTETNTDVPPATALDVPLVATPAQQEGPFYPVDKPEDRDADLFEFAGSAADPVGTPMELTGSVMTTSGLPVAGVTIEIWQTDSSGIYLHPNDPGVDGRDANFQGYGEAITDGDGAFSFSTIDPGYYEPRPRHVHFKVVVDGEVVLTSQIYFSDDPEAATVPTELVAAVSELDGLKLAVFDIVLER